MIVIIGATGFIGTYAVEEFLNNGYEVLATGNKNEVAKDYLISLGANYLSLDINKEDEIEKLPKNNVEGVILLGGLLPANAKVNLNYEENAREYILTNTVGTINILEYCRKNKIRKFISTSSYADVYNSWSKERALTEKEPRSFSLFGDHAVYVISKNAANDLIDYYNSQHNLQGSIFRLPPVYGVGPHDVIYDNGISKKSGIATFIEKAQNGEEIEIFGDPLVSRDIVYVKDVTVALVNAIESDKSRGLYNITSGVGLTLKRQVETVIEVFAKDVVSKIVYSPQIENNSRSYLFDVSKARMDFGYDPVFKDYKKMMIDYKKVMNSGKFNFFKISREKN
ncbi:NAD(P)-dependent oxidoreductase [Paenibacillus sp. FSL R7-0337]|uniref:NAD-dependent epimerase/dehydratase family protein n=1 Tax=Paenibacillus sp. FSL R7-0337 TaxID=1926588 RepID=UPI00096F8A8B|nr:NAD(P)-dependent oxidoreductase [Paenibacillus sp. FSL R7-0337]OMF90352.1 nucleoside-diphosphate sugar epimerase [Paenibacillus sp. FSL R7-0337]